VNLLGCLLLGYVGQEGFPFSELSPRLRMAVGIGFLGGLTTFSTFGYELWQQLELGHRMAAGLYLSCSVFLGLCATWLGATLARW
jgi:CrcB protein